MGTVYFVERLFHLGGSKCIRTIIMGKTIIWELEKRPL